jgi:hypothetical protein
MNHTPTPWHAEQNFEPSIGGWKLVPIGKQLSTEDSMQVEAMLGSCLYLLANGMQPREIAVLLLDAPKLKDQNAALARALKAVILVHCSPPWDDLDNFNTWRDTEIYKARELLAQVERDRK